MNDVSAAVVRRVRIVNESHSSGLCYYTVDNVRTFDLGYLHHSAAHRPGSPVHQHRFSRLGLAEFKEPKVSSVAEERLQ